jgi:plastocyanin
MIRVTRIVLSALVCAAIPATAKATPFLVRSSNFAFTPANITVAVGDTVRFQNQLGFHTATNGTGSGDPQSGLLFNFDFNAGGQFGDWIVPASVGGTVVPFYCVFHETLNMRGNITVTCSNGAPVVNGIAPQAVDENVLLSVVPTANDPNGDTLTWSGSSLPSGASVNASTGELTWTPSFTQAGLYTGVTLIANDNKGCNATGQTAFDITVNNVNRAPSLAGIPDVAVDVNTLLFVTTFGSDPDGDALTWSGANLPAGASVNPGTGELTWTPGPGDVGVYPGVAIVGTDPGLLADSSFFQITVNAPTGVGKGAPGYFGITAPTTFRGDLAFVVSAPAPTQVDAVIVSASGQVVARIPSRDVAAGRTVLTWSGGDAPRGVYLLRVASGAHIASHRVVKLP